MQLTDDHQKCVNGENAKKLLVSKTSSHEKIETMTRKSPTDKYCQTTRGEISKLKIVEAHTVGQGH